MRSRRISTTWLPVGLAVGTLLSCGPWAARVDAATIAGTVTVTDRGGGRGDPAGAVVWIEAPEASVPTPIHVSVRMREKTFDPEVVAVPIGSTVSFPNADPILHNVFSVSGDNGFDLGLYGEGIGRNVVFRAPGVVRVYCNVHPQMEAFVVVAPGRWVTLVAADGTFRIDHAPAGRYEVHVWAERGGMDARSVEIAAGDTASLDFSLDATRYRRRPHLDKTGRPYARRERY